MACSQKQLLQLKIPFCREFSPAVDRVDTFYVNKCLWRIVTTRSGNFGASYCFLSHDQGSADRGFLGKPAD